MGIIPRVVILGLDGATMDLIKPWAEEGKLPVFKRLLEEGVHGPLESTIPWVTIPAWPSFATGVNPAKHGYLDFFKECDENYNPRIEPYPSRAVRSPTLWKILSDYDKRVAVINVPSTFPPLNINGYMITGMLTPTGARSTFPPELMQELNSVIGDYHIFTPFSSWQRSANLFVDELRKRLDERLKAALYFLTEKEVDFLMVVDNGTDMVGHELWRFANIPDMPSDDGEIRSGKNPLLRYYLEVDRAVGELLSHLRQSDILLIMSDHGMGSVEKFISLNTFLIQHGFISIRKSALSRIRYHLFKLGWNFDTMNKFLRKLRVDKIVSGAVSSQGKSTLSEKLFFSSRDIDWAHTRAYAMESPGGIRINLKGREPLGSVAPAQEYEAIRHELMEKLRELRDPSTGARIIDHVFLREEIYQGGYLERAPDIVATPVDRYEFYRAYRFPFPDVVRPTFGHSGAHRRNGVFMAKGGGIKRGSQIAGASILDIMPTVLHIMDVPISSNIDGKVLDDIFESVSEYSKREKVYKNVTSEGGRLRQGVTRLKKSGKI